MADQFLKATWRGKRNFPAKTDVDAYLAGFFDGEGHICVAQWVNKKKRGTPLLSIGATQTMKEPIMLLKRVYGGSVGTRKRDNRKRCWEWRAYGKDALYALMRMMPYLLVKVAKARAGIIILQNTPPRGQWVSPRQRAAVTMAMKEFKVCEYNHAK